MTARQWVLGPESDSRQGYTDNVVDLLVGKLNRLPVNTQEALKAFACLARMGVEMSTLAIIHGRVFNSQDGDEEPDLRSQASSAFRGSGAPPRDEATLLWRSDGGITKEEHQKKSCTRTCGKLCASSLMLILRLEGLYQFIRRPVRKSAVLR